MTDELYMGALQLALLLGLAYLTVTVFHMGVVVIVKSIKEVFKC